MKITLLFLLLASFATQTMAEVPDSVDVKYSEIIAVLSNPQVLERIRVHQRRTHGGIENVTPKGNSAYSIQISGCYITVKVKSHIDATKVVIESVKLDYADVCT
jgi:hypothetical protein